MWVEGGILKEMLDLAAHIVHMKSGHFDLSRLEDRYENALIDRLKNK
jgi:non-homologous end joining protein Ku